MAEEVHKIMVQKRALSTDDLGRLMLFAALLFGTWFRVYPPLAAEFPINDGGLFHEMIEAIKQGHYRLPEYIQYNGLNIPFAYPPLALYIAAAVSDLLNLSIITILQWMPAVTLILVLPAIHHLAFLLLGSRFKAGLATLLYALLPRSITWLIMGGGITRSLGQLFLILAVANLYCLFTSKQNKYLLASIAFSSLVCLVHPEAAIHTIGSALLLWFFYGRDRRGSIRCAAVALGTLLVTSPWWATTLMRFGMSPFLSAAQTGLHSLSYFIVLFVPFSGEPFLTIIALLAILGLATKFAAREYFLPAWLVVPFLIEPRSAANVSIIPMAFLASLALTELIFPVLSRLEHAITDPQVASPPLQSRAEKLLFIYLTMCLLIGMQYFELDFRKNRVSPETRLTFEWITSNTPAGSKFLILTGQTDLFSDFTNEWFPVLTDGISLTTIQGYEWVGQDRFGELVPRIQKIQQCAQNSSPLACIKEQVDGAGIKYDYIYVAQTVSASTLGDKLIWELEIDDGHILIHKAEDAAIFEYIQ